MKRMIAIMLVILAMTAALTGCGGRETGDSMNNSTGANTGSTNNAGSGTNGSYGTTVPDNGAGTPSSNESGIIEDDTTGSGDTGLIEEFGNDMRDMADDAGNAVQDAVQGRHNRTGTGMAGGR